MRGIHLNVINPCLGCPLITEAELLHHVLDSSETRQSAAGSLPHPFSFLPHRRVAHQSKEAVWLGEKGFDNQLFLQWMWCCQEETINKLVMLWCGNLMAFSQHPTCRFCSDTLPFDANIKCGSRQFGHSTPIICMGFWFWTVLQQHQVHQSREIGP